MLHIYIRKIRGARKEQRAPFYLNERKCGRIKN